MGCLLFIIILVIGSALSDYYDQYRFDHLSPSEHLRIAKANSTINGLASRHLVAIPRTAPEYPEAQALLTPLLVDEEAHQARLAKELSDPRYTQAQEQAKRDEDAQIHSYWPTTLRVDTDMDSFWLKGEERVCQTYPDEKGRVSVVACNLTSSRRDHNIPVKFWGGVDRNVISGWKCRREDDDFVCRAID